MNPTEIEFAVKALVAKAYDPSTFAFDLIAICNAPKVTVSKLRSGQTNAATFPGDVLWKKRLFFRSAATTDDVGAIADSLVNDPLTTKHKPRFIVVTNGDEVHIRDLTLDDTCNIEFSRLDESSDFLLPLAGFERRAAVTENPADVKAAKRLAKLYDAILAANPTWSDGNHTHELNLFMTRVLFCFYAEDTGILETPQLFTHTVAQHSNEDGGDVAPLLERLFAVMNVKVGERSASISSVDNRFPYVNGSLFETTLTIPNFNRTARRLFLECGELDWQTINPDIFGSMIQTIAEPGARGDLGMHYTSVPNIMKVLQPLFLDELNDAFEKAKASASKLDALLVRLAKIRVFDPACGSGNFLIIAYKELRHIEMRILERIGEIVPNNPLRLSGVSLHSFFGIDIVDFACETAKLSLWIAEYQMNSEFKGLFGAARPPLPLGKISTIHCGNSLRLDWFAVCPRDDSSETYICGNPPYRGSLLQTSEQKADLAYVLANIVRDFKDVEYVSGWFVKLSDYIATAMSASGALVATNSICQGEQVPLLWPYVIGLGLCITFAHTSFRWANSASHNAGVTCIIVGLGRATSEPRRLYVESYHISVPNINPYLVPSPQNIVVTKCAQPLSDLPPVMLGNIASDGGHLVLSAPERRQILEAYPNAAPLIRRFYGSREFLHSLDRFVLWIADEQMPLARSIPPIAKRLDKTQQKRKAGGISARPFAETPHRFVYITHRDVGALIIPQHSSDRRQYLQVGILTASEIASNALFVVYSPPPYLFALLSSRLHRLWTQTVGGKLEERLRYSNGLVYNTFPVPALSGAQEHVVAEHSKAILKARAKHPAKTIAWLYNPETMPAKLLEAHQENDTYLEECVYGRTFKDDTQRLEHLFAMYARLKAADGQPNLFAEQTKKLNKSKRGHS
jgi:hypothetical protein